MRVMTVICALCLTTLQGQGQAPRMAKEDHPAFEVATVKPTDPGDRRQGFRTNGRQITIENESVTSLLMYAYGVHPKQIVDGPAWMEEKFDIHGIADLPGEPNRVQFSEMLQKLLEERFALRVRREKREMAAYTLTVAKGGSRLRASRNPDGPSDQDAKGSSRGHTLLFTNVSMDDFALLLHYFVDLPVVNRTDLPGKYDFTIDWKPDSSDAPNPGDFPDLFTAFQEQLGLKLSRGKDKVDALVVEKLERPTPN